MADLIPQRQEQLLAQPQTLNPTGAGSRLASTMSAAALNFSASMAQKAQQLNELNTENTMRSLVAAEYSANSSNPDVLKTRLSEASGPILTDAFLTIGSKANVLWDTLSGDAIQKSAGNYNDILTGELALAHKENLRHITASNEQAYNTMFSGNPNASPAQRALDRVAAVGVITNNMRAARDSIGAIGPDGRPIYTTSQKMEMWDGVNVSMGQTVAQAFIDNGGSYYDWINDKVTVPNMVDGVMSEVNIRQAMDPQLRMKVDKQILQSVKSKIDLRSSELRLYHYEDQRHNEKSEIGILKLENTREFQELPLAQKKAIILSAGMSPAGTKSSLKRLNNPPVESDKIFLGQQIYLAQTGDRSALINIKSAIDSNTEPATSYGKVESAFGINTRVKSYVDVIRSNVGRGFMQLGEATAIKANAAQELIKLERDYEARNGFPMAESELEYHSNFITRKYQAEDIKTFKENNYLPKLSINRTLTGQQVNGAAEKFYTDFKKAHPKMADADYEQDALYIDTMSYFEYADSVAQNNDRMRLSGTPASNNTVGR